MSQIQLPPEIQRAIDELVDEISFQNVLLSSIDDSVQDRETAEQEVEGEIKELEKRIRRLRRGATSTASNTGASSQPSSPLPNNSSTSALEDSSAAMDSFGGQDYSNFASSSTESTPNSGDSANLLLSPNRMTLPTRKRTYSKHLDGALAEIRENKSSRTSPSLTGPTTPSTISSGDDEFQSFDTQYFAQKQKETEEVIQREKLDEEFARSLQSSFQTPALYAPSGPSGSAGPSAFDRLTGVRASQSTTSSSSSRKLPWNSNTSHSPNNAAVKPEPGATASSIKNEGPSSGYGFHSTTSGIKGEERNSDFVFGSTQGTKPSRTMPGAFSYDFSDDDSDIEVISASLFHDNGRHVSTPNATGSVYGNQSPQMPRSQFSPEAQAAGQAALRRGSQPSSNDALQHAMYAGRAMPSWMNTPAAFSQAGMANENPFGNQLNGTAAVGSSYVYPNGMANNPNLSNDFGDQNPFNGTPGVLYNSHSNASLQSPGIGLGYSINNTTMHNFGSPPPANPDPLADMINRAGPSNNYDELRDYLQLGDSGMGQLDYLMNDPRKTTQELKELLENIRPDTELPPEDREGTPDGLKYPLYEHQKLALTWMKSMEEGTNKGGILADDMGLGKTISALALMLSRPSTDPSRKTTLIVGPVALVRQWKKEMFRKVKPHHRFSVNLVHGQGRKLTWDELRSYDVVLTTYGTLAAEMRRYDTWFEKQKQNGGEYDEAPCRKLFPLLGPKSMFYRIILDEAQAIKNKSTISARACCNLKAAYRFCLTGTPMMNNVGELYSLIHFLRIKPYNEWSRFQKTFGMLTKNNHESVQHRNSAMKQLQAVLKAILLRRTKTSLIDGKPIIQLPPKTEEIQHVVFDEDEQAFYTALETKTQVQFNKYMKAGTVGKNYSNILVLLLRLRQACCHPHLIHDFEEAPPAGAEMSMEKMVDLARSLAPEVVERLLAADGFECPVCYDAVVNPRIILPCGHDTCTECLSKITDQARQQNLAEGNEGPGTYRCPSCRGELSMTNVIDYKAFCKVHKPDAEADNDAAETASESSDSDDSETESSSEDGADSDGDLRDFIVPDGVTDSEDEVTEDEQDADEAEEARKKKASKSKAKKREEKRRRKVREGKRKEKKPHLSLAMLKKEASRNAAAYKRYFKYLKKNWQPSAKVTKCVDLLDQFHAGGHKTIVFSQFVSLLDLLQVAIQEKHWNFLRYDGGMNADARQAAIDKFMEEQSHNIILISLKAGNSGLNLTAADRVIILDPFWNPYIEMQAIDRAYRIGQQREVQVHRILIQKTVEDRIIELQEQKRKLVDAALDEGANKSLGRLDSRQLAFLFGVGN